MVVSNRLSIVNCLISFIVCYSTTIYFMLYRFNIVYSTLVIRLMPRCYV